MATPRITIVYFIYINPAKRWHNLVGAQLEQLIRTGILEQADLHAHITGPAELTPLCEKLVTKLVPTAKTRTSTDNQFEYPAIHLIWQLAQETPDRIFLYFHSKGMSSNGNKRVFAERALFQEVIEPWKKVLAIFDRYPGVNKVGFGPAIDGLIWFNFWWARGKYLSECIRPEISPNRWYYEGWLGGKRAGTPASTPEECYSLADDKTGVSYTVPAVCDRINDVVLN